METVRLTNDSGLLVEVARRGAAVTRVLLPDRHGRLADVVHGFDDDEGYARDRAYVGVTVGRVANRIAGAAFDLDGVTYPLAKNDLVTGSQLHGGLRGWNRAIWSAAADQAGAGPSVELAHVSPDGDEGFPGTMSASVRFTLTRSDELHIDMAATTDRPTPVNMVHHGYWNLGGTGSGTIEEHELTLHAGHYLPGRPPTTAEALPVAGTPLDFTAPRPIGPDPAYDHALMVDGEPGELRPVARLRDPRSGRVMTLAADQPSVQLYTAGSLDGAAGGKGARHTRYSALCLESQAVPNAVHIPAWREDVILRPGRTYRHRMVFRFSAE